MFGKGGSSSDHVDFEIFRELESGNPIGIASVVGEFSPFKRDPSAKVYVNSKTLNYPMVIKTVSIDSNLPRDVRNPALDISVVWSYEYPGSFSDLMLDLSPSQFSNLVDVIKREEAVALKYLTTVSLNDIEIGGIRSCNAKCRS